MKKSADNNKEKVDNRAFCFCMGEQVDCLPGVVLDCNNKRTSQCPLQKEQKREARKKKDTRAFCFCLGEQVDCLPGVVLDCNNKRTRKCPLLEESAKDVTKKEEKKKSKANDQKSEKDNRAFCFCMGAQVDCLPGVVLDCNNKRTTECPLVKELLAVNEEKEEQVRNLKEKYKKKSKEGAAETRNKQDSKNKSKSTSEKKKDNRAFCFCLGAQVDCLPGVVLDCNNKRTTECPLVKELLSVNADKEKRVKELKEKYHKRSSEKSENLETKEKKPDSDKKDNRAFCFCLGMQVDCLPGVVLDCNNKRTTKCPLLLEALSPNKRAEAKIGKIKDEYEVEKEKQ